MKIISIIINKTNKNVKYVENKNTIVLRDGKIVKSFKLLS